MSGHYNLVSWNVNGLRAVVKKGFLNLLLEHKFDVICIQETKASSDKLPREVKNIPGYYTYFVSAEKNGYCGVGIFSKKKHQYLQAYLAVNLLNSLPEEDCSLIRTCLNFYFLKNLQNQ